MRVCLVVSVPLPAEEGIGHHAWNLAQQLTVGGHEVSIVTRGSLAPTTRERRDEITIWRPPFVPAYPLHVHLHAPFVNRLLARLEQEFDLVNAHTPLPPAVKTRLPLVTTVHSPMRADTAATHGTDVRALALRMATPVMQRVEKSLFVRSQKITAVAGWVAQELTAYGVARDDVVITGNGVERAFFDATQNGRREPYVLYVGRLDIGKGLEELIEAARIVLERCPDSGLRFVLAGKGPLLPKLQNLVREAGVEQHFEFRGHIDAGRRDELVELYRRASMFVLPSHHEGMPTVLLEAMAAGVPAISTAVGGALEVVNDGQNALLVPPREPQALARAILRLLQQPALGLKLGQNARRTVESRYSWPAIGERYLGCYEEALSKRGER